jgi:hypothetical protein
VSHYTDNLWAEEMGIDLSELEKERFDHPDQMQLHRKLTREAAEYWAREHFLAQLAPQDGTPVDEIPVKAPRKRAKVRRYEFTDKQLEIAQRVLDARGGV